jgi:hypothetical protein
MNKFKKIRLWFKFEGQFYPKDLVKGIKNIFKWLPIVWKDRDYDDGYIFDVLKFKLKNTAKYIGDRDFHTNAKKDSERMMLCVRLIEKVQDEYYRMEYGDYHETKFEFVDLEPGEYGASKGFKTLKSTELSENFDDYFAKHKATYKRILTGKDVVFKNDTKHHIAMNIGMFKHNQARKLLFSLIERHIEGWWD